MKPAVKTLLSVAMIFVFAFAFGGLRICGGNTPLEPLTRGASTIRHFGTQDPVMIPVDYEEKDYELRGVWIATVFQLNMPLHQNEAQYKAAFSEVIDRVVDANMNAVFFQVRPMNDAFYDSELAPFSRYLTGSEGTDPGWDVMEYLVEYSHSRGIEFHAWLNPYRVGNSSLSKSAFLNTLHPDNFARQNPDLVIAGHEANGLHPYILNPGEPAVRTYIRAVIDELVTLYDVDGVHFDDYFYPYSGLNSDTHTYNTYAEDGQSIADFRRESVNAVVRGIKEDIDAYNDENETTVRFGISPFGIWKSGPPDGSNTSTGTMQSYVSQFADSKRWVEEEWVHYIAPQIYWNFAHNLAPYADIADWWASVARGTDVDVLIGHAIYGTIDSWLVDEISTQLLYNQKHPEIKGSIFYSAAFLNRSHVDHVVANRWTTTPLGAWEDDAVERPVIHLDGILDGSVYRSDVTVFIESAHDVLYRIGDGPWTDFVEPFVLSEQGTHALYAKAVDEDGAESPIRSANIVIEKVNDDVPHIVITGERIGDDYVSGAVVTLESNEPAYIAINHGHVGEWNLYEGPVTLTSTGNHFIRAKTVNAGGIESDEVNKLVRIVDECAPPPVSTLEGEGSPPYYTSVTFSVESSAPSVSYRINGGLWTTYVEALTFDEDGQYTVDYRNDAACAEIHTVSFTVMNTPPPAPTIDIDADFDGRYYTEEAMVTLVPAEADHTIRYRLHNGISWTSWRTYTEPFELSITATYTVEAYAIDAIGNESELLEKFIRVKIPPTEDNPFVIRNGVPVRYYNSDTKVVLPAPYVEASEEIRAVWVATVHNIDIGTHVNEAHYKTQIIQMLDRIQELNFNVVFFQVRPMNDAFYPSSYAPFSRYLTGLEGKDPGWDVLEFIITEAHKRNLELHAWLNPYRVSNETGPKSEQLMYLHDDNFAKQNPDFVLADNNGRLILDPGQPQVRAYVLNVIRELMGAYDVDGIHFDDYFYSYSGMSDAEDEATYLKYRESGQSRADWRRSNVDTLVREIFEAVEDYNDREQRNVKFGISPFGIWKSGGPDGSNTSPVTLQSYHAQYADTKKWVEEGWVHYIMPQLYWEFAHSLAPFADLVDWWADLCAANDVDLIIGQGFYRYIDGGWDDENEFLEQLRYMSQYDSIVGSAVFSYRSLNNMHVNVLKVLERLEETYWTTQPDFTWATDIEPYEEIVCDEGEELVDGECVVIEDETPPPSGGCFNFGARASLSTLSVTLVSIVVIKRFRRYDV